MKKCTRHRNRDRVAKLKDKPCEDCSKRYHFSQMQFDHIKGSKVENIGTLVSEGRKWKKIEKEISKCDLVCANCHALRTYKRLSARSSS